MTSEDRLNDLISVVQDLSMARTLHDVTAVVRTAARRLTGSDGTTFVLRDGDLCYYADEDAIAPLWKGQRFPMTACISGWVMLQRQHAVIKDIYDDPRIPTEAYRPTFVKSLAMVPIRTKDPIGAIGNYWAKMHEVDEGQLRLIKALADSASIAIENVRLYHDLEKKVAERTAELEAFSYAISHDLKAPLRAVSGFAKIIDENSAGFSAECREHLRFIREGARNMTDLIEALLRLSKFGRQSLQCAEVDLSQMTKQILHDLSLETPTRKVDVHVQDNVIAYGDSAMLRAVLDNLIRNAWKFTRHTTAARIQFGSEPGKDGETIFFVKDNGAGFDPSHKDRLFRPFQRWTRPIGSVSNRSSIPAMKRLDAKI